MRRYIGERKLKLYASKTKILVFLGNIKKSKDVRALIRIRCGDTEEDNKYWLEKGIRIVYSAR